LEKLEKLRYEKHLREQNLEKMSNDSKLEETPINKEQEDTTEQEEVLDTKTDVEDVLYLDEVKPDATPDTQKPRRLVYDSRDGRRNAKITRL